MYLNNVHFHKIIKIELTRNHSFIYTNKCLTSPIASSSCKLKFYVSIQFCVGIVTINQLFLQCTVLVVPTLFTFLYYIINLFNSCELVMLFVLFINFVEFIYQCFVIAAENVLTYEDDVKCKIFCPKSTFKKKTCSTFS